MITTYLWILVAILGKPLSVWTLKSYEIWAAILDPERLYIGPAESVWQVHMWELSRQGHYTCWLWKDKPSRPLTSRDSVVMVCKTPAYICKLVRILFQLAFGLRHLYDLYRQYSTIWKGYLILAKGTCLKSTPWAHCHLLVLHIYLVMELYSSFGLSPHCCTVCHSLYKTRKLPEDVLTYRLSGHGSLTGGTVVSWAEGCNSSVHQQVSPCSLWLLGGYLGPPLLSASPSSVLLLPDSVGFLDFSCPVPCCLVPAAPCSWS